MLGGALSIGGAVAGGLFSGSQSRKGRNEARELAQFRPWNVNSPFFGAQFDPETNTINTSMSEPMQALSERLMSSMFTQLGEDPQDYYDQLAQLSQEGERRAVLDNESRLFNQGRLGSTGGALQQQALQNSMNEAMIGRELAARQYQGNLFGQALQGIGQMANLNQAALAPAGLGSGIGINMAQIGAGLGGNLMQGYQNQGLFGGGLLSSIGRTVGGLINR